jgi:isoleucyl-tRNA synthetase
VDSDKARNALQVAGADFVSTEDGTGIVHLAPAYGEDDKATADTADIVAVHPPVDSRAASIHRPGLQGLAGVRGQRRSSGT